MAENRSIREKIDALRKEKVVFDKIYEKLERELKEKKKDMKDAISNAERACEAREALKKEITKLKEADEMEEKEYQRQVELLKQYIEKDKQVKGYLETKQQLEQADLKNKQTKGTLLLMNFVNCIGLENMTNTSLNERINTEKALRKKALEKANEIASIINGVGGDRMKYMTGMISSEENADGLPSTKDLKNLRDEKKAAASIDKGNKALEDFQEAGTQNEVLGDFVDEVQHEVDQLDQEIEVGLNKQLRSSLEVVIFMLA